MTWLTERERDDIDRKLATQTPCPKCVHGFEDEYCSECRYYWGSNFEESGNDYLVPNPDVENLDEWRKANEVHDKAHRS